MPKKEISYGFIDEGKIYLSAYLDYPDRAIGEVKDDDEEASVRYFEDRFLQFQQKVEDLEKIIEESTNKGSFLMKLKHMQLAVGTHDGLGDYQPLIQKLASLEEYLGDIIARNRERNTEIKRALTLELEEAVNISEWKEATEKVLDIKARWVKTGNATEEFQEDFENRFTSILNDFFERKREFYAERQRLTQMRVDQYRALINKATEASFGEVRNLQSEWREVGKVPSFEYKKLLSEFQYAIKRSSNRGSNNRFASPEEQQQNFEKKNQLLEELKAFDPKASGDPITEIKNYKNQWKSIGNVPKEHYRDQQKEFTMLADILLERCFLEKVAENKEDGYGSKNSREQVRIQMRILRDLLSRDERELQTFYDNMNNIQGQRSHFSKMADQRLNQQKHKVQVKKALLRKLKLSLDTI